MHMGTWLCATKTLLVNTKILISKNFHMPQKSILILYFSTIKRKSKPFFFFFLKVSHS